MDDEKKSKIASAIRDLRVARGYKQTWVAGQLRLSPQVYSNYESGARTPDPYTLLSIARLLQVSIEDILMGGSDLPVDPLAAEIAAAKETLTDSEVGRVLSELLALPPERRRAVLRVVGAVLDAM